MQKQIIEVIEKKRLEELLTAEEIQKAKTGIIVFTTSSGDKISLKDDVSEGTIIQLTPLQGG